MITPLAKPRSRADEKAEKKKQAEKQKREVWAAVTKRDGRKCRACGRNVDPNATDMLKKGHHHHIRFRSAGGRDETANLCLLCAICHSRVHAHRLIVNGNADSTLTFEQEGISWHG